MTYDSDYHAHIRTLNENQYKIFLDTLYSAQQIKQSDSAAKRPPPLHILCPEELDMEKPSTIW